MFQLSTNLFVDEISYSNNSSIDIVIRTFAASIFGYFIGSSVKEKNKEHSFSKKHVGIISLIGMFSLLVILLARNFVIINDSDIRIISQLRDFVSASIGFLISVKTNKK